MDEQNIVEKPVEKKEEPVTFKAWLDSIDWKALDESKNPHLSTLLQAKKHYDLSMTQKEAKLILQAEKFITNAVTKLLVQHERYQILNDISLTVVKSLETWKISIEKTLAHERTQKQNIGIDI